MGLGLVEAVGKLLEAPLWSKSDADLAAEVTELLAARDRVDALISSNLGEAGSRGLTDPSGRLAPRPSAWIRSQAGVPIGAIAARRIARREWTRGTLVNLAQLHDTGLISTAFLDAAGQGLDRLPAECRTSIDEVLSGAARGCDPADVAAVVAQVRAMVDPEGHTDRAEHQDRLSRISISPVGSDGAYAVTGVLYGLDAERFHSQVHSGARDLQRDGDSRSPAERRASALFGMCRIAERATGDPEFRPAPHGADVHVTLLATTAAWTGEPGAPAARTSNGHLIDPATLAAIRCTTATPDILIADHTLPAAGSCERCNGRAPGDSAPDAGAPDASAPNDAELLRRSLTGLVHPDASYRILPLVYGRARRTASPAQWQALLARDQHCTHPNCTRGPGDLQAHHLREYDADAGATDLNCLGLLCWQHHTELHRRGEHLHPPWCTCHPGSTLWVIHTEAPELHCRPH